VVLPTSLPLWDVPLLLSLQVSFIFFIFELPFSCFLSFFFFFFVNECSVIDVVSYLDMGAAYGTAKSGVGVASMGVIRPELVMRSIVPVVMAGVIGIYGLIIAVVIVGDVTDPALPYQTGFADFGAGLAVGLSGLAAGMAIGIVGDAGVRATAQQPKLFVGMILILIFAEALGLYGLIVGLILTYVFLFFIFLHFLNLF
jgi:V-type H+-transporting ATPase 16kDa proteolipid subunit